MYPNALKQPYHSHNFASFSFVCSGRYQERFGRTTHDRHASTVVFHPPGESHSVAFETNVQILSVKISFEKLSAIREQIPAFTSPESCRTDTIAELGTRVYRELNRTDTASEIAIEGLILEIIAGGARLRAKHEREFPVWLREAKDYVHDNFSDTLSLDDLAAVAGVHPGHLARVFREKVGCTIGEYVRRLRIESSKQAVLESHLPLSQIAASAGFYDQSHFNRVFKSTFGVTPTAYRRKRTAHRK
jgi:AraC family transcriptional regulator